MLPPALMPEKQTVWGVGRGGGEVGHKKDEMGRSKTSHSLTGLYLFLCF